jgi:anti-sigma factor RsiW
LLFSIFHSTYRYVSSLTTQHAINLFVWPSSEAPTSERASISNGYNLIGWHKEGMAYWVVSDLNLAELQQFVQLLMEQNQTR